MTALLHRLAILVAGTALSIVLVSCGGSGGGSNDQTRGEGTVGILLTDMPADPAMFEAINASIRKVELLGSDDSGRVVLYSGPVKVFDLFRLRNEAIPLAYKDGIPAGRYCKIRLTLSDLELVLADDTPGDPTDNETYHPKLPGNGKMDLLARGCFDVAPSRILTLQIDMDAGNSIHIVKNKKGYQYRPVVYIDVVDQGFASKLVRLSGKITKIDAVEKSLLLCDAVPADHMNNLGCVSLRFGDDAAFFDNREIGGYGGMPRPVGELLSAEKLGLELTVVGWPGFGADPYAGDDDDSGHHPLLRLDVLAAELGEFLQVGGTVATDADQDGFTLTLAPGGPVLSTGDLAVMLQPGGTDFNGTRIVSRAGELLLPDDIDVPLPAQVDGTLQLMPGVDPVLQAALVIVDRGAAFSEQVTGVVLALGAGTITIDPDADTVCGIATDSLEVGLADDTRYLTVTIDDSGSEIAPGGTPAVGQTVGMNGTCQAGGYATDNVVIVDDQR